MPWVSLVEILKLPAFGVQCYADSSFKALRPPLIKSETMCADWGKLTPLFISVIEDAIKTLIAIKIPHIDVI